MRPRGDRSATGGMPPPAGLEDMHWPLYTVGQVAQIVGVPPAFLRRLDTEQIVQPARSPGGQRRYSRTEISRIEQVAGLAGEGFTLSAIRRVLELQAEGEFRRAQPEPPGQPGADDLRRERLRPLPAPRDFITYVPRLPASTMAGRDPPSRSG